MREVLPKLCREDLTARFGWIKMADHLRDMKPGRPVGQCGEPAHKRFGLIRRQRATGIHMIQKQPCGPVRDMWRAVPDRFQQTIKIGRVRAEFGLDLPQDRDGLAVISAKCGFQSSHGQSLRRQLRVE